MWVGNDVVDLGDPRSVGKAAHARFVQRVFTEPERLAIAAADDPDLELWSRWAAKEAAFKVVSKRLGAPPVFVHHAFEVVWDPPPAREAKERVPSEASMLRIGTVRYGADTVSVRVEALDRALTCVGADRAEGLPALRSRVARLEQEGAAWGASLAELRTRFTERERGAIHSWASAAVRLGARADLALALGVDERRLEIVCGPGPTGQRPPFVVLDGAPASADVSLSHDGQWIAWTLWVEPS